MQWMHQKLLFLGSDAVSRGDVQTGYLESRAKTPWGRKYPR